MSPRATFRKIITSEALTAKINKQNIKLMKQFLKEKSIRTSTKTIKVYESNILIFMTWNLLHNNNKLFTDIKKIEFSDFFYFASEEMRLGSSRLNNLRSTLSSLSNFIEKFMDEEYPDFRNVILKVVDSAPKELRREKAILTDEQIESLLEHLRVTDTQKACWLALAVTSGARFSELLLFEADLIDENKTAFDGLFLETTREIKTKGRGRSGKMLYKYVLRDKFLPFFRAWMIDRHNLLTSRGIANNRLFLRSDGNPATNSTVRGWVSEFEAYLAVPLYTHALRHFLVTLLSRKNIPYNLIQAIFGWESSEMVKVYDDSTIKDKSFPELENLRDI